MSACRLFPIAGTPDISYATGHRQLRTRFRPVPSWLRTPRMVQGSWDTACDQRAYTPTYRPCLAYGHSQRSVPALSAAPSPFIDLDLDGFPLLPSKNPPATINAFFVDGKPALFFLTRPTTGRLRFVGQLTKPRHMPDLASLFVEVVRDRSVETFAAPLAAHTGADAEDASAPVAVLPFPAKFTAGQLISTGAEASSAPVAVLPFPAKFTAGQLISLNGCCLKVK